MLNTSTTTTTTTNGKLTHYFSGDFHGVIVSFVHAPFGYKRKIHESPACVAYAVRMRYHIHEIPSISQSVSQPAMVEIYARHTNDSLTTKMFKAGRRQEIDTNVYFFEHKVETKKKWNKNERSSPVDFNLIRRKNPFRLHANF